jgi:hypothetical protein
VDEFLDRSDVASALTKDFLNGNKNIIQQIKQALQDSGIDGGTVRDVTIGALLAKLTGSSSGAHLEKLEKLQRQARALGLEDVRLS